MPIISKKTIIEIIVDFTNYILSFSKIINIFVDTIQIQTK